MFDFWFNVGYAGNLKQQVANFPNIELNLKSELWISHKERYPWQQTAHICFSQLSKGACRPSHIRKPLRFLAGKEERFFLSLKKQTVAFFPIDSTVCAGAYLFSHSSPFFPIPINSWWNYCIIPWKLPNVSRCCRLKLIARQRRLGCSWLLVLMWSDRASEAGETTEDHSTFQSCSRSYQVNRRLNTNQAKKIRSNINCFSTCISLLKKCYLLL